MCNVGGYSWTIISLLMTLFLSNILHFALFLSFIWGGKTNKSEFKIKMVILHFDDILKNVRFEIIAVILHYDISK